MLLLDLKFKRWIWLKLLKIKFTFIVVIICMENIDTNYTRFFFSKEITSCYIQINYYFVPRINYK